MTTAVRWPVFIVFFYFALVMDQGLTTLWTVYGDIRPQPVLILAVFIALSAPPRLLPWVMLIMGVAVDLLAPLRIAGSNPPQDMAILGPHALGYLIGGYVTLQLRNIVFRDSTPALAFMTLVMGIFVHLTAVLLINARALNIPGLGWWLAGQTPAEWSGAAELVNRTLGLLYTALIAIPLGWLLIRTTRWWGFGERNQGGA